MADPIVAATPTPAPVAPVATPVPQVSPASPPPVAETPVAGLAPTGAQPATPTPAPAAAAAAAPSPPKAEQPASSLLGDAVKPPIVEPPKEPAVVEPAKPAEPTGPAPVYEPFKIPDGVELNKDEVGKFAEILGKFELDTKADHTKMQAFGQQMIERYIAEAQRWQEAGQNAWTQLRDGWRKEFMDDPAIGKQNQAATLERAGKVIRAYGGTAENISAVVKVLADTGAGDHPAVIRLLDNIGKVVVQEPDKTATGKQITPQSTMPRSARRYANTLNGNGAN